MANKKDSELIRNLTTFEEIDRGSETLPLDHNEKTSLYISEFGLYQLLTTSKLKNPIINEFQDLLFEEISNLKLKFLSRDMITVEKVVKKIDKDRYSALVYMLWYVNEFETKLYRNKETYDFTNAPNCVSTITF